MNIERNAAAMKWKRCSLSGFFVSLSVFYGCGGAEPQPECKESEYVYLTFRASPELNRDVDGSPRSTYLHVSQLRNAAMAEQAPFQALWSEPKSLLADALLDGPRELVLIPGGQVERRLARHPDANLLLFVGNFRQIQGDNRWRVLVALPPMRNPCANTEKSKRPPPLKVGLLLDGYQIYSSTNFQAITPFEAPPKTTSGSVAAEPPDWREPGTQPASPGSVSTSSPPDNRPVAPQPVQSTPREEKQPQPAAVQPTEEEPRPVQNPRSSRTRKKTPPSAPKKQEAEVPLL